MDQRYPLGQRRLRATPHMRDLTREIHLSPKQFIQPYFVVEGIKQKEPIPGLEGVFRDTEETLASQVEQDLKAGCSKMLLFGVVDQKREKDFQYDFMVRQISKLKERFGSDLWLATDICLCTYTTHGHCGYLNPEKTLVENSKSVAELARQSHLFAAAGADCVAPSDMMDGRIGAMRNKLNEHNLEHVSIMSYSAKFHSNFYGPFRGAADSAPDPTLKIHDRSTYQIDPAHPSDALACAQRDAAEGADILMVKPGMPYLDILSWLSQEVPKPWAVYQVSGEFAAINQLAKEGLIDARRAHLEAWTSFVRAGASMVISYGARNSSKWVV